ncbi:hypothetical protein NPIL_581541 [Nephila pilipes]|uniref:Uncharacterized protein n=1 Tax=Nephila pilipes TaxID=299642 RepID=A0A8X6MJ02_NEPPI|nr:hypothetical protein NPIL_581541 [Nephila pilipes]
MNQWRRVSYDNVRVEMGEWSCGGVEGFTILTTGKAWKCDVEMKNFVWCVVNDSIICPKERFKGLYIEWAELVQCELLMNNFDEKEV